MFGGRFTTGSIMLDKIFYGATAIVIITAIVIFGSPIFNVILASFH